MPALPRRFVIWFSLHYSKPESFSDAVLDKCGFLPSLLKFVKEGPGENFCACATGIVTKLNYNNLKSIIYLPV
jgi:hypothetical protein